MWSIGAGRGALTSPVVLVVALLGLSWWFITSMWKDSKKAKEGDKPGTLSVKDYLTIVACVIAVLVFFAVFPEYIAPHVV